MSLLPSTVYAQRIASGRALPDEGQQQTLAALDALTLALNNRPPLWQFWRKQPLPRSLYIYGSVGRGKSLLMDLFFATAPEARKRRVHFHAFMLEVHEALHQLRQNKDDEQVLLHYAQDLSRQTRLLCFDEFFVNNIADAMILSRLFAALQQMGVVIVSTSNAAPDELYKNGLQRVRFEPFIDWLKQNWQVIEIGRGVDHRRDSQNQAPVYFTPLSASHSQKLQWAFQHLAHEQPITSTSLAVQGRRLVLPRTAPGVALCRFAELCEQPLASADYIALAQCFQNLLLDDVPRFTDKTRDVAMRFITLIDVLYEHKTALTICADAAPDQLYVGELLAPAFARTASRLIEMQSREYRQQARER